MRFGVFLLSPQFPGRSHAEVLDATVAAAVAAEEAGFDDVWVAEHHFQSYGLCPSALTLAGYLLGATSRVTVGTAVTVLATQHPVAVAEQALLLDQVSRGRFRLGVGRGGPWIDQLVFGANPFAEALDALLTSLAGRAIAGFPDIAIVPEPRTRPGVVVAATAEATVELAARRQLPLLLGMHAGTAEKAAAVAHHNRVAGRPVPGHVSVGIAHVADTDAEAVALLRDRLPRWLRPGLASYRRADGAPHRTRDPDAYAELLCRLHPVGSPETCRRRLAAVPAGVDHVALMVETTGEPARTLETIRRLGVEVLDL